jgi:hypothetical protein
MLLLKLFSMLNQSSYLFINLGPLYTKFQQIFYTLFINYIKAIRPPILL